MPAGNCKMCLQQKTLVSSHLMPAALYSYCQKGKHKPVKLGGGFVLPTDRQTQDYLLCEQCEGVLNKGGESWIAGKLATWERTFPLYDLVTNQRPDIEEDGMACYATIRNPEIKADKLTHFALGLFWKASVHSWSGTRKETRIELGPYSDRIRRWLRNESQFPNHIYLIVMMSRPQRAQITLLDPYEGGHQGNGRHFYFHVPGLVFTLNIGKTVDESMRHLCIQNNPGHPLGVSDILTDKFAQMHAMKFRESYKTKSFLRQMEKIGQERKP